jgi:hypothetical protein
MAHLNLTPEEVAAHQARVIAGRSGKRVDLVPVSPKAKSQHKLGRMNKTEAEWASKLDIQIAGGEVLSYLFESIKIRLANKTWYTLDFLVFNANGTIEVHETKGGFIRDDAMVKFKVAAEQYPCFTFFLCVKNKQGWKVTRY